MPITSGRTPAGRGTRWFVVVFGMVFVVAGLGIGGIPVVTTLIKRAAMASWTPVPAVVLWARLDRRRSSNSTTYNVVARYRYRVAGVEYTGSRINLAGGFDNIGEYHQLMFRRLDHAARTQQPVTIWVDPDNPADAIADRSIRWGMLGFRLVFLIAFGIGGAATMWFGLRRGKKGMAHVSPDQPWLANRDWRHGQIRSSAKTMLWFLWGGALVWNAVSSPVIFMVPKEFARGNYPVLFALLFPLVGLGIVAYAIKRTIEWRRFGATLYKMDPFPGSVGGDVGGTIELRWPYRRQQQFRVSLSCVNVYTSRSGGKSETRRRVIWQDEGLARREPGIRGTRIAFKFAVPAGLPESEEVSQNYHEWRLNISADLPGVDLDRDFIIPVFNTGASSTIKEVSTHVDEAAAKVLIPESILQIHQNSSGLTLTYPLFRKLGVGLGVFFMGLLFAGVTIFLSPWVGSNHAPFPMILIFGLFSLLMLVSAVYTLGNSLQVTVNKRGIMTVRRLFGIPITRTVDIQDIVDIDKTLGMQSHTGSKTRVYYKLKLRQKNGKQLVVGDSLPSASSADYVRDKILTFLGLQPARAGAGSKAETDGATARPDPAQAQAVLRTVKIGRYLVGLVFMLFIIYEFRDVLFRLFK